MKQNTQHKEILPGDKIGHWTVLCLLGKDKTGNYLGKLECVCGKIADRRLTVLRQGKSTHCGCLRDITGLSIRNTPTHNLTNSPEYSAWQHMKDRCFNSNASEYKNYGERGITVCDKWINSFESFYEYIGKRPSNKHSLGRINNDGNYEPGNVKWETIEEQNSNRRNTVWVKYKGQNRLLTPLIKELNIHPEKIYRKVRKGQTLKEVLLPFGIEL